MDYRRQCVEQHGKTCLKKNKKKKVAGRVEKHSVRVCLFSAAKEKRDTKIQLRRKM